MARYTYAPGYIDAVACQERDLNADGDFADSSEVVYYHSTTLYSVYALTDSSENVVERYRYDPYGQATVLDADHSSDADGASDVENPYLYTGRRLDRESGLMQYRHRYYAPGLGRFVSRDPEGYVDGYCLYEYVGGKPIVRTDPKGLGPGRVRTYEESDSKVVCCFLKMFGQTATWCNYATPACKTNCGRLYSSTAEIANLQVCHAACLVAKADCIADGDCTLKAVWVEVE